MIIDVLKTITRKLSRCVLKEPDTKATGVTFKQFFSTSFDKYNLDTTLQLSSVFIRVDMEKTSQGSNIPRVSL